MGDSAQQWHERRRCICRGQCERSSGIAVPDQVVSATCSECVKKVPSDVTVPVVSSKRKKKKRKKIRADAATPEKKKRAKATSKRDLPTGVRKLPSGNFVSEIGFCGKSRNIGTFDTPEQASAAYVSVKKDLDDAKLTAVGADVVNDTFEKAQKKAVEAMGGFRAERDLPPGVYYKKSSERFEAQVKLGGKRRSIGMFDTPEQASTAYMSMRKDLDDAKQSAFGTDAADTIFDAAKKKAIEAVGGNMPRKQKPRGTSISSGVRKTPSGEFEAIIRWGGKHWYVGIFDAPEQASIAYASVERDLFHTIPLPPSKPETVAHATFDAAKKKALQTVQVMIESRNMTGRMF